MIIELYPLSPLSPVYYTHDVCVCCSITLTELVYVNSAVVPLNTFVNTRCSPNVHIYLFTVIYIAHFP